jgi:mono/diheme cytochrome c family protein
MKTVSWPGIWLWELLLLFSTASSQPLADRGNYLVDHVAHCGDCHTRLTPEGRRDWTNALKGTHGRVTTPDITSSGALWKAWREEGFVKFLETSVAPDGRLARHPMSAYKLRPDDAGAIAEYLKTLR